jgi:Ser/Thr protein kinase RdoA (MazF antagonist)
MAGPADFAAPEPDAQLAVLQQLAEEALKHWPGQFSDLKLIKFRENAVFSAMRENGRRVAVRLHRHGYHTAQALRSELDWMRALVEAGIYAPPVIPDATGESLRKVTHSLVPEGRYVDLLEWLPGTPIGSAEDGVATDGDDVIALFEKVGALAGCVHNQSAGWEQAAGISRHHWDSDGLIGSKPFWGPFWTMPGLSAEQIDLIERACVRAALDLADFGQSPDRYSLIHADFVPENLLYDGQGVSLIDFDDCGFGWHMFELATALFFTLHQPNYEALRASLLRGYRQVRALPEAHEAHLPLFLFLRGTTYLGWIQTRSETQTAKEMAPMMIERVTLLARRYLGEP